MSWWVRSTCRRRSRAILPRGTTTICMARRIRRSGGGVAGRARRRAPVYGPVRAAIDTGALLALASSRDQYHEQAVAIERRFRRSGGRWVGTVLVLAELQAH